MPMDAQAIKITADDAVEHLASLRGLIEEMRTELIERRGVSKHLVKIATAWRIRALRLEEAHGESGTIEALRACADEIEGL